MKCNKSKFILVAFAIAWPTLAAFSQTEEQPREPSTGSTVQRPEPDPGRRISSRPARNRENSYGFSLGILGLYDSNMFGSTPKEGLWAVAPSPRLFANLGTRKSMLHLDYQLLYRFYPTQRDLDSANHEGGFEYLYQASRRTSFSLREYVRAGPNDILAFTNEGLIAPPTGYQQVFFDGQHMLYNSLAGLLKYQPTRKHNLGITGDYYIYRYRSQPIQDTDSFQARIQDEYQVSKQWSILGEASNEWVDSSEESRKGTIMRFMGGLVYRPNKNWRMEAKAGEERMDSDLNDDNGATYEASLTRDTGLNRLEIRYNRRSGVEIGLAGLNRYHEVSGFFDQQLGSRVSLHLLARFYRTDSITYGKVDTWGGGMGFDYAFHPSLVSSVFGHYVYERAGSPLPGQDMKADRYIVYGGLTYLFPSVKRERRIPRYGTAERD